VGQLIEGLDFSISHTESGVDAVGRGQNSGRVIAVSACRLGHG
jgi:hypothetical protein